MLRLTAYFDYFPGNLSSIREVFMKYKCILQDEAKALIDAANNCVVLDVRTIEEFRSAHIAGAILIPDYEIFDRAEAELTDKSQLILVYCRSGRRSKAAAAVLTMLGYSNVMEFGGIIDWPYGVVSDGDA